MTPNSLQQLPSATRSLQAPRSRRLHPSDSFSVFGFQHHFKPRRYGSDRGAPSNHHCPCRLLQDPPPGWPRCGREEHRRKPGESGPAGCVLREGCHFLPPSLEREVCSKSGTGQCLLHRLDQSTCGEVCQGWVARGPSPGASLRKPSGGPHQGEAPQGRQAGQRRRKGPAGAATVLPAHFPTGLLCALRLPLAVPSQPHGSSRWG